MAATTSELRCVKEDEFRKAINTNQVSSRVYIYEDGSGHCIDYINQSTGEVIGRVRTIWGNAVYLLLLDAPADKPRGQNHRPTMRICDLMRLRELISMFVDDWNDGHGGLDMELAEYVAVMLSWHVDVRADKCSG